MKVRHVTIEIEVPWNAEYETALRINPLDGKGLLHALDKGLDLLYDLTCIPYQAQIAREKESHNTQIGVFTEWLLK